MPQIPAFCDNCGKPFRSGIAIENSYGITMTGNKAGPCPFCGSMGHIPDGVYNIADDIIQILTDSQTSIDDFRKLEKIILDAKRNNLSSGEINNAIEKEAPKLNF